MGSNNFETILIPQIFTILQDSGSRVASWKHGGDRVAPPDRSIISGHRIASAGPGTVAGRATGRTVAVLVVSLVSRVARVVNATVVEVAGFATTLAAAVAAAGEARQPVLAVVAVGAREGASTARGGPIIGGSLPLTGAFRSRLRRRLLLERATQYLVLEGQSHSGVGSTEPEF
jgi:hypothetical protein